MTGHVAAEPYLPFLESRGWKIYTIITLVYFGFRVLSMLMGWMKFWGKHCCRAKMQAKNRIAQTYNKSGGSWAVVSGGSDGIGLAMCKKLAREGFNICMMSRTESKINDKLEEIKKECPNIQTMPLVADLGTFYKIEDYQEQIADKLKDLDVSMLVINAGYNQQKGWLSLDNQGIQ